MFIQSSGIFLYFLMSLGSGYAVGNLRGMSLINTWLLSVCFVPIAYELINENLLMLVTVIGFSFGLFLSKSLSFFDLMRYISPKRFLRPFQKRSYFQSHFNQPQFSTTIDLFEEMADGRKPEQVLGLPPDFTQADLKAAYQRESNRTHPDKWANKPDFIKKAMEREQTLINIAYQKLKRH